MNSNTDYDDERNNEELHADAGFLASAFMRGGWFYWACLLLLYAMNYTMYTQGFMSQYAGTTIFFASVFWAVTTFFEGMLAWYASIRLGVGFMSRFVRSHMSVVEAQQLNMRVRRAGLFAIPGAILLLVDLGAGWDFGIKQLGADFNYGPGWFLEWGFRWFVVCFVFNAVFSLGQEVLVFWRRDLSVMAGYLYGSRFLNDVQRAAVQIEEKLHLAGIDLDMDTLTKYGFRYNFDGRFQEKAIPTGHPFERDPKLTALVGQLRDLGVIHIGGNRAPAGS